jgi:hypothetical protein
MNKACRLFEENLIDFMELEVPESLKKVIEDHLENCPSCARLAERFWLGWDDLAKRERLKPPVSLWPGLYAKISLYDKAKRPSRGISAGIWNFLRPGVITLLFLSAILFGFYLGDMPASSPERALPEKAHHEMFEEIYVADYLKDFQDFPVGSMSDLYIGYKIQSPDEQP